MIQWICTSNAGVLDLIPGRGNKIPLATWWDQKKKKKLRAGIHSFIYLSIHSFIYSWHWAHCVSKGITNTLACRGQARNVNEPSTQSKNIFS